MPRDDLGSALKLLRFVRGWEQRQLARAAKLRGRAVAEFEGGSRPEPEELRRLIAAMGFPPDAVDRAQRFLAGLREKEPEEAAAAQPTEETAVLEREVEQLEAEMDGVRSHLGRLLRELARRRG